MRTMKMLLVGVGSAALLATGGVLPATAASSNGAGAPAGGVEAQAWGCTKGAICFYTKKNGTGTKHERFANTNRNINGINSIRNNGKTDEPLDHVKVKWNWSGDDTSHWGCFSPGEKWSGASVTIDAVRWVNSC